MKKPDSLRAALTASVPQLQQDAGKLLIFIDEGRIISTGAPGLSFEYQYTLKLIVTDYADPSDTIILPVLAWLQTAQPDMLQNPDLMRDGFQFEADILNHQTCDLEIRLKLTERVIVKIVDGVAQITHPIEPPTDQYADVDRWELYIDGELARAWPE